MTFPPTLALERAETDPRNAAEIEGYFSYISAQVDGLPSNQGRALAEELAGDGPRLGWWSDGLGMNDGEVYVPILLTPPDWAWAGFETWRARIREDDWLARRFKGALSSSGPPLDQLTLESLLKWARLSHLARRVVAARPKPLAAAEVQRRGARGSRVFTVSAAEALMEELEREGFGRRLREAMDRIEALTPKELRGAAEALGLSPNGDRFAIIARLRRRCTNHTVAAVLPERVRGEPALAVDGFPSETRPWVDFQRAKLLLLAHAVSVEVGPTHSTTSVEPESPPFVAQRAVGLDASTVEYVSLLLRVTEHLFRGQRYSALSEQQRDEVDYTTRALLDRARRETSGG